MSEVPTFWGAELLSVTVFFVAGWLALELFRHRRALQRIPVRVHVNGTRGKSSVTRLIAAGLRGGGKRVVAKTTGTLPRVILSRDRELPVHRPQGANVREQIRIVRFAAARGADILVAECMALQPFLQWLSERMFIRATHGVITNARPDHLDVMGPTAEDVAKALAGMMPRSGMCFTAERDHLPVLRFAASDRESRLIAVGTEEADSISDGEMARFRYHEHRENVALALAVCEELGVSRAEALAGMWAGQPDPGALTFHQLQFFGRDIWFVNAFAANDPVSSEQIYELCRERFREHAVVCVVNCRVDRADRSRQLGEALRDWIAPHHVVATGTGTVFFVRAAVAAGFDVRRLTAVESTDAHEVFERLVDSCGERTLLIGLGNIGGLGLDLVRLFRNRSAPAPRGEEAAP